MDQWFIIVPATNHQIIKPHIMKDFMLIFIGEDYEDMGMSPEQMQERMGRWHAWSQKMTADGVEHQGEALHSPVTRISGEKRTRTDMAGAEVKELVGGYYVVKVKDREAAVQVAQDFPDYDLGSSVEIREVVVFG